MNNNRLVSSLLRLCLVAMLLFSMQAWPALAKSAPAKETITGTIVPAAGNFPGTPLFTVNITANSSPAEVQQLNAALASGGQEGLLKTLKKMDKGNIEFGQHVGIPISAVIETPTETGTKITILFERYLNFFEVRNDTVSEDYRFGLIEINLDRNGKGAGKFVPAAKIKLGHDGSWNGDDYIIYPAQLIGVQDHKKRS